MESDESKTGGQVIIRAGEDDLHIDTASRRQLIALAGGTGAGKSSFAARSFLPTQIVSTDRCRALVGDREDVQAFSRQAFELFYFIIEKRMELSKLVVADSTALRKDVRRKLLDLARRFSYSTNLVVFTADLETRRQRNQSRSRVVEDSVLVTHEESLRNLITDVESEPWERIYLVYPSH